VLVSIDGSVIVAVLIGFYLFLKLVKPHISQKLEIFKGASLPASPSRDLSFSVFRAYAFA